MSRKQEVWIGDAVMFHPTETILSDLDIEETAPDRPAAPVRFMKLWALAERMYWDGRRPRWFWRWLLRRIDEVNGYRFEHLDGGGE